MRQKHIGPKPMGCCKGGPKGEIHSHPSLTQKNKKISNAVLIFSPQEAGAAAEGQA